MESAEEERRDTGQAEGGGFRRGKVQSAAQTSSTRTKLSAEEKTTKKSSEPGRRSVVHRAVLLE